jgi:RNA-directed DNA polymerase
MLRHIPTDKKMLRQWLKAGYVENGALHATEAGTPQGGIISPVLANLALDGMERMLRAKYRVNSNAQRRGKVNLIRYADDFVISGSSQEVLAQEVKPMVENFLRERGLRLSESKTKITPLTTGIVFLGFEVRKRRGKLVITPSKASLREVVEKIHQIVEAHQGGGVVEMIVELNRVIRGWCNYFRHVVSSSVFGWVDSYVFKLLWRWTKRRHPDKNAAWRKEKYFTHPQRSGWNFCACVKTRDGAMRTVTLLKPSSVRIIRHVKIQGNANPYDPAWERYFEARHHAQRMRKLAGKFVVEQLWRRQVGICPHCQQPLYDERGCEIHHIAWRVFGGTDEMANLQLLHPNCHQQVHDPGYNSRLQVSGRRSVE